MTQSIQYALDYWRRLLTPKPKLNIWQWADSKRFLAKGVSQKSKHGSARYNTADAPHQREMMESPTDPTVQTTVYIGASQVMGKTEVLSNVIGYHMEHDPANMVIMYPTVEAGEKFSKKKLMPNIRATPSLDALVPNSRTRDSGNTILVKEFIGGSVFIVGSNSPSSLRGASGEVLIADEIDSNEDEAGSEGDAVKLLWKRGESFPRAVQIVASTPTVEGRSRIWSYWEQSDQRLWYVPCPHCGVHGVFKWSMESAIKAGPAFFMEWPTGNTEAATLVCASCAKAVNDDQRLAAYHQGAWKPTAPFTGTRGYHLNWLYVPWAKKRGYVNRLHQMASEWEDAKKAGPSSLKVLINTGLCECWKEKLEEAPDSQTLANRRETYAAECPLGVVYLTCSVDTQADRLEYEVLGWGIGEETWGIETGKLMGNPHLAAPWQKLDEILNRSFAHESGVQLRISCTLVDSGGQNDSKAFNRPVYSYVKRRQLRHIFALKGSSELGAPVIVPRLQKNGILLYSIGTDSVKSMVYERLQILEQGPGYCHWPDDPKRGYDDEYFRQLVAESVRLVKSRREWVKTRARNEALDLRVYGHAAFEIRNVNLESVARSIMPKTESAEPKAPIPITAIPGLTIKPAVPVVKPKPPKRMRRTMSLKW